MASSREGILYERAVPLEMPTKIKKLGQGEGRGKYRAIRSPQPPADTEEAGVEPPHQRYSAAGRRSIASKSLSS